MSGHCVCVYYQAVRSSNKMQHVTIEGEMWRVLFHVVQLPVTYVSAKQTHIHRELHNVYAKVLLHTVKSWRLQSLKLLLPKIKHTPVFFGKCKEAPLNYRSKDEMQFRFQRVSAKFTKQTFPNYTKVVADENQTRNVHEGGKCFIVVIQVMLVTFASRSLTNQTISCFTK